MFLWPSQLRTRPVTKLAYAQLPPNTTTFEQSPRCRALVPFQGFSDKLVISRLVCMNCMTYDNVFDEDARASVNKDGR
jgi:hypothetical protein